LAGIDSVIETDAPGFDLYSGGVLQMSLSYNATTGALLVKQSTQPFAADSITYQMAAAVAPQTAAVQSVTFEMSDCIAQPTPAQDPKSKVPPVTPPPLCASTQAVLDLQQVVQQQQQQQQQSKVPAPTPVPSPVPAK
jgi:hypothetical protein